jgi:rod shape determining protein RodA
MLDYAQSSARAGARGGIAELGTVARRVDWLLVAAVAAVVAYGLWAVSGITHSRVPGNPNFYLVRQSIFVAVGAVALVIGVLVDPIVYRRYWRPIYGVTVGLMVVVFLAAPYTRGSRRWIDLGFFRFQPSEFGKLLFVLALAGFVAERGKRVNDPRTTLATVGFAVVPILLVFKQPDFGTALVYGAALAAVLFFAGVRWLHVAVLCSSAALLAVLVLWALPAAGAPVLKDYQKQRLTSFVNPGKNPSDATYNVTQSKVAIGAGGFRGRGLENSTQTDLNYLPESNTDFAFAAFAEQRGFVGAAVLLLLYLLVVWRGLRIVAVASDAYSAIVAGAIVVALLFEIFINVGMTMAIAPVTGIPLPFLSVGGSSMIANLTAMGVLLSIHARGAPYRRR